jgi:5-methylcytosine-specific restriction enzyme A
MSASKRPRNGRRSKTSTNPEVNKEAVFRCPACHSDRVRPIVYGLPGEELIEEASRERVILGGCTLFDNRPLLACLDCDHRWN